MVATGIPGTEPPSPLFLSFFLSCFSFSLLLFSEQKSAFFFFSFFWDEEEHIVYHMSRYMGLDWYFQYVGQGQPILWWYFIDLRPLPIMSIIISLMANTNTYWSIWTGICQYFKPWEKEGEGWRVKIGVDFVNQKSTPSLKSFKRKMFYLCLKKKDWVRVG